MILFHITFGCIVLIPVVGSFRRRHLTPDFQLLLTFFWFGALFVALEFLTASHHIHNVWLSHIYHLTEYGVFVWIVSLWEQNPAIQRLERLSILVYALLWGISKMTFEPFMAGGVTTSIVSHTVLTLLSLRFLHILMGMEQTQLLHLPRFIFLTGLIIYASGDLLFYSFYNVIRQLPRNAALFAWQFHLVVNIIGCLLFTASFLGRFEPVQITKESA